jgi:hypothetical protein
MSSNWDALMPGEPVILKDGVTKAVRISGYSFGPMDLTDAQTQQPKTVQGLKLHVTEEDGARVEKDLNIVSKRLIAKLRPYLENNPAHKGLFKITAQGTGLETDYSLEVIV